MKRLLAGLLVVVGCARESSGDEGLVLEAGSVSARFSERGAVLLAERSETLMRVSAIGRADRSLALNSERRHVRSGDEVRATIADGVVEWWRSLPTGLEHGVTLAERPEGDGPLFVEVQTTDLSPSLRAEGVVELRASSGAVAMTYAGLVAYDASGARLPSHMGVEGGRIVLSVNDAGARYPLVIDPLVVAEEATLAMASPAADAAFGSDVSITADGSRAFVVGDTATIVFLRSGTTWTRETTFGGARSGAISSDGTRLVLGTSGSTGPTIFVRSGVTWSMEHTFAFPATIVVALDADGTRAALVSGTGSSLSIRSRSGTTWSMEGSFTTTDTPASVAMSRDGATVALGGPDDDPSATNNGGVVRVYTRAGSTWTLATTLTEPAPTSFRRFGSSVAISADGLRLAVGAPGQPGAGLSQGRAFVFVRAGTTWSSEGTLVAPDASTNDQHGSAVAISADGRIVLAGAPGDATSRGSVRAFVRSGSTWTYDGALLASDGASLDRLGASLAVSDPPLRALVGAPDDTVATRSRAGSARVLRVGGNLGWTCTADAECGGGFCTDGVCCSARCDGECESCAASGMCTPSPSSIVCRASAGACDPTPELCNGTSGRCPADVRSPAGTSCRVAAGGCDVAESCDGSSAACPADVRQTAMTECRAATTACDRAELCDGTSPACPAAGSSGVRASGTGCRAGGGLCDVPEVCDGVTTTCPGDVLLASGTPCGAVTGSCASAGMCSGSSPVCTGSAPLAAGTVCLYASAANPCDVDDVCDGTSTGCIARFEAAGTVCNDLVSGLCDTADLCTGTSADCAPTFLSGVECRAPSGECDSPEFCSGSSPVCPPDAVEAAGMSCRTPSSACDPVEVCDGIASSCPDDVNDCPPDAGPSDAGARDGGVDGGGDASTAPDAGAPAAVSSCGCRAGARAPAPLAFGVLGVLAALLVVRRRSAGHGSTAAVSRQVRG